MYIREENSITDLTIAQYEDLHECGSLKFFFQHVRQILTNEADNVKSNKTDDLFLKPVIIEHLCTLTLMWFTEHQVKILDEQFWRTVLKNNDFK